MPRFTLIAQQVETPAEDKPATEEAPQEANAAPQPKAENPAPINITVTPDGRIVISSDDVAALDQLEDLMAELEPPRQDFEVFPLKNSRASLVAINLEEYFADELSDDDDSFWPWGDDESAEDPATLGKSRKLRFIWDSDTNTIVAQNASESQLEVIRRLIEIYDQAPGEDAVSKRRTDIVQIRYSSAQDIATAIKEVYRDLLSSKDKEFQRGGGGENGERDRGRESRYSFWGGSSSEKSAPMKMSFEGALSIGVDEISNTLIISADEQIWENVKDLAVSLDEKAKPDTVVQIHQLRGSLDPEELQDALSDVLSQPWPGGKPSQGQNNRGGEDRGRDRGGDRDRDRGRDRGGDGDGDRGGRDRDRD
jgi:type II secretory pathway component GspD/PulD (secretin)